MKKITSAALALAATALFAGAANAQIPHITPFSFEARGGVAVPTGDLNDVAGPGLALNGNITYHFIPVVGVYAGYSVNKFSRDGAGDYQDNGAEVGLRVGIPTPLIPIDPWIKGGAVFHRLELSGAGTSDFNDSGVGFELGAGLGFGFGPISITPGVTYVSYKYDASNTLQDQNANYVKADIGVRVRL